MAGGSGTRFWPRSRRLNPKQTLPFLGGDSLLQRTLARLTPKIATDDIFIVAGRDQIPILQEQLPSLPCDNFIQEPCPRNTAPCIGLAANHLAQRDPTRTMLVIPADHFVKDDTAWLDTMLKGCRGAQSSPGTSVVFGVVPTEPQTGYGYVSFDESADALDGLRVLGFHEKPDRATAQGYISAGNYYWNSGCFAWRVDTVLTLIERHVPDLHRILRLLDHARTESDAAFQSALAQHYPRCPSQSVDYAIMEKAEAIVGYPLDVGWSDVGTWTALFDVLASDENGNVSIGPAPLLKDCKGSLFWSDSHMIAAIGLDDIVVVESKGVVLVCPCSQAQRVRELVDELSKRKLEDYR